MTSKESSDNELAGSETKPTDAKSSQPEPESHAESEGSGSIAATTMKSSETAAPDVSEEGSKAKESAAVSVDLKSEETEGVEEPEAAETPTVTAEANDAEGTKPDAESRKEEWNGAEIKEEGAVLEDEPEEASKLPKRSNHQPVLEEVEDETQTGHDDLQPVDSEPQNSDVDEDAFDSDDFGEFDEFEESSVEPSSVPPASTPGEAKVLDFGPGYKEKVQSLLPKPQLEPIQGTGNRFTRTAVGLWHQLMEDPSATFIQWEGSALHRKLVQSFGVPLDLDQALPKVETRKMSLETEATEMQHVPQWTLLSIVSQQAIDGMSEQEQEEFNGKLRQAITDATALLESLENHEMDLRGEKDVLEGMVDSLLAYAQKSQRNQRQQQKKKK